MVISKTLSTHTAQGIYVEHLKKEKTMSNNKQSSSIDFFWNQLPEILPFTVDTETAVKLWEAFEQAKAMHKKEIEDACKSSITSCGMGHIFIELPEQYYNETYGKEEQ